MKRFILSLLFAIGVCSTVLTINNFNVFTMVIAAAAITIYHDLLLNEIKKGGQDD